MCALVLPRSVSAAASAFRSWSSARDIAGIFRIFGKMRKNSVRRRAFPLLLLHEMEKRNVRTGLASLCVGGGLGISKLVRRT
ncbi:hypothetical protein P421_15815 [Heyndrickxia coagulans P38]|nr:hypothetical protein P421_15815 [Heyndrickxia coagulans P38]